MPRKLIICFENVSASFESIVFPRKLFICFENTICSFEDVNVSKKVSYLLRKYDLFIEENAKATPKGDELTFVEAV